MKNEFDEFKKLGQRIEQCLGSLVTKIAKAEDSQTSHSRHLLAKLPSQGLMRDASNFFMNQDDWTMNSTQEPFDHFYSTTNERRFRPTSSPTTNPLL